MGVDRLAFRQLDNAQRHTMHCFERVVDEKSLTAVCQGFANDDMLLVSVMRSMAARLGIPIQDLDIDIGLEFSHP